MCLCVFLFLYNPITHVNLLAIFTSFLIPFIKSKTSLKLSCSFQGNLTFVNRHDSSFFPINNKLLIDFPFTRLLYQMSKEGSLCRYSDK